MTRTVLYKGCFTGSQFSRQLPATIQSGLHVSMNSRPLRWPRRRSRLRVLQIGYNVARTHTMTRSQTQRRARTLSERKHVDRLDARPEARTLSESNEIAQTRSRAKSSLQPSDPFLLSSVEVKRPRQIRDVCDSVASAGEMRTSRRRTK